MWSFKDIARQRVLV